MQRKQRILVTSALPYANGPIHLGHLAGAYLPADIYARFNRLKGNDVLYICGSDEHGVPIILRARSENTSPQKIVDYYHNKNKESFKAFGITFDYYGRTSSAVHRQTSQQFFKKLSQKNMFILNSEEQLYDPEAKMFLADRFVRGTCPHCEYEEAYGDQCERCGSSLSPTDLLNPRSAITNTKPILKTSTHWYLPLSKLQKDLENWIKTHKDWKPNVLGQIQSWFDHGLKDRAVTRDLLWGVPVPDDVTQNIKFDASGKVLYVWFDAPIGYISATIEWALEQNNPDLWKTYWQDRNTKLIHFIGKDNIVFHCLIFPAMLMAHGGFNLPDNVPANEFLNLEGNKLSTSRNYAVWLDEYLDKFEADSLRYCLANNLPETRDSDFSWKDFQARHNNELADILGNFINRTITFTERHFEDKVPNVNSFDSLDKKLIKILEKAPENIGQSLENFQIREAVKSTMDLVRFANKYFNDKAPWSTVKTDIDQCRTTINLCLQTIKTIAILFEPVIPYTTQKIKKMLNLASNDYGNLWDIAGNISLKVGHKINPPEILFKKIDDGLIKQEEEKLKFALESKSKNDNKFEEISKDQFDKIELRVAEIIDATVIPKTDNLLKLRVKLGEEERQVIASLAQYYQANDLISKKVIIVSNLKSIKILGEISEGMLLTAKSGQEMVLLTTDKSISSGSIVR